MPVPAFILNTLVSWGVRWIGWHYANKIVWRFEEKVMSLYQKGMDKRKARAQAAKEIEREVIKDIALKPALRKSNGSTSRSPPHPKGRGAVSARPARGPERTRDRKPDRHRDNIEADRRRDRETYRIPSREEHVRAMPKQRDMPLVRQNDRIREERYAFRDDRFRDDRSGFPTERRRYYNRERLPARSRSREASVQRNNYGPPKRAILYEDDTDPFEENIFLARESPSRAGAQSRPERRQRREAPERARASPRNRF